MAITTSGQIKYSDINFELGRSSTATIAIHLAELGIYGSINTNSSSRPDGTSSSTISEWYGYNHTASGGGGGGGKGGFE